MSERESRPHKLIFGGISETHRLGLNSKDDEAILLIDKIISTDEDNQDF
jgi:hypothetical protein